MSIPSIIGFYSTFHYSEEGAGAGAHWAAGTGGARTQSPASSHFSHHVIIIIIIIIIILIIRSSSSSSDLLARVTRPHRRLEVPGSRKIIMFNDTLCEITGLPNLWKFLHGPSLGIDEYLCLELDICVYFVTAFTFIVVT